MTKNTLRALMFILLCGSASDAAPLFVQMTVPPTNEWYSYSQPGNAILTADDFVLGSTATIQAVTWQGANSPAGAPGPDAFRILFYTDPIDPSSLVASFDVGAANRAEAGSTIGAGDVLYNYWANLGGVGFTATAGTRYWITIINDELVAPVDLWTWAGGASGTMSGSFNNGQNWFSQPGSTNFTLDSAPIPEPATLTLLGLGLMLGGGTHLRHRRLALGRRSRRSGGLDAADQTLQ
jgi:hypothetical protein